MTTVAWLHISDWHEGKGGFDRDKIKQAMIEDIKSREKLHPRLSRIDFVVFSGDVANTGAQQEYNTVKNNFLFDIISASGFENNYKGRVFICPGNHDLERTRVKDNKEKYEFFYKKALFGNVDDRRQFINNTFEHEMEKKYFWSRSQILGSLTNIIYQTMRWDNTIPLIMSHTIWRFRHKMTPNEQPELGWRV